MKFITSKTIFRKIFYRIILPYIPAILINIFFEFKFKFLSFISLFYKKKFFSNFIFLEKQHKYDFQSKFLLKDIVLYERLLNIYPQNDLYIQYLLNIRRNLLYYILRSPQKKLTNNTYLKNYLNLFISINKSLPKTLINDLKSINLDFDNLLQKSNRTTLDFLINTILYLYSLQDNKDFLKSSSSITLFEQFISEGIS